jgi:CheY-like chemotaxis protein
MVIKPLPEHMRNNEWVTGVAITGKNDLVSVLHIPTLFSAAKAQDDFTKVSRLQEPVQQAARILIVDDSFNTREIEKSILESGGYSVSTAKDGVDGLNKAGESQFDLIVTDCDMPNMDGFDMTQALRKQKAYQDKPIVMVTSKDREEDRRRGMEVGADAYIIKGSFDQSLLLETVESLIG